MGGKDKRVERELRVEERRPIGLPAVSPYIRLAAKRCLAPLPGLNKVREALDREDT